MPEETQSIDQQIPTKEAPKNTTHKISWLHILIGVVVGAGLLGAGFGVYFLTQSKGESTTTPTKVSTPSAKQATPSATATPSAEKDETADWETYISKTFGFSIRYQKEKFCSKGQIEERKSNLAIEEAESEVLFKAFDCLSDYSLLISIVGKSYQEPRAKFGDFDLISELPITVAGIKTAKKIYGADPGTLAIVVIKSENSTYVFQYAGSLIYEQNEGDELSEKEFDQILSTFKFLD